MTSNDKDKLLDVKDLKVYFYTEEGTVPAVDGLDFSLAAGETLAIVGESGCGKSVTAMSILRIVKSPPGKIESGSIKFEGRDLLQMHEKEMLQIRGNEISMIFQEPLTSLNPLFTIGNQIAESLKLHQNLKRSESKAIAIDLLRSVGIANPERVVDDYPHQLSGGMRQRAMIAMALACNPKILIADEPTTALDVTIQAQILHLINDIKKKRNTAVILITHDLGIVAQIAQNAMVMYAGLAVEYADVKTIFSDPRHPYTVGLLKSIPVIGEKKEKLYNIQGAIPRGVDYPKGCRFAPRCDLAIPQCLERLPELTDIGDGHLVRCIRYKEVKKSE